MSSLIWTQCAGKRRLDAFSSTVTRIVEDQSKNSTRKLVDSDQEQARLEDLIEGVKPAVPRDPAFNGLHYLLFTPFRYPPLRWGSRFRKRAEPGVWYGSENLTTALAEKAYYRIRFLLDTAADLQPEVVLTAFQTRLQSGRAVDLTRAPFAEFEDQISNPQTYAASQPMGTDMRQDQVVFCFYRSARDPERGRNAAVFSPLAFAEKKVSDNSRENWHCIATREFVEMRSLNFALPRRVRFERRTFEIHDQLPMPDIL